MSYAVNPFGRDSVVNYHHMILSDHGSNVRIVFQLNLNFPLHFLANKHLYCYRAMFQRFIDCYCSLFKLANWQQSNSAHISLWSRLATKMVTKMVAKMTTKMVYSVIYTL